MFHRTKHLMLAAALLAAACSETPLTTETAELTTPARQASVVSTAIVTTTADAGAGSLRQAILDAPAGGATTITFAAAVQNQVVTVTSGELAVAGKTIILDAAPSRVTIDANGTSRVFNVAADGALELRNITVRRGHGNLDGGGILNAGTTTLNNSVIKANTAVRNGAGIQNSGILTIVNSQVSENVLTGNWWHYGAGIHSDAGSVTLTNVTMYHNRFDPAYGYGAAIGLVGGSLSMKGGSIYSDGYTFVAQNAGGIYVRGSGSAVVDSTSMYLMRVAGPYGPIFLEGGSLTVTRSRFGGNTVQTNGAILYNKGGNLVAHYNQLVFYSRGVLHQSGTSDVNDNYWGCDGGPNASGCSGAQGVTPASWMVLGATATPSAVLLGGTATVNVDISKNSLGQAIAPQNRLILAGKTIEFMNAAYGTVAPASAVLDASGKATATFTASSTQGGLGGVTARTLFQGMGLYNWGTARANIQVGASNTAPVANAGADQTVECTGATTAVTLNGSASSDADGDPLTYTWKEGNTVIAGTSMPTVQLTHGTHAITLEVSDGKASSTDVVVINVVDTRPPVITLNGSATMTLEAGIDSYVEPGALAADACDGAVSVQTSGSVNVTTVGDYTITYTATDRHGNSASRTRTVRVRDTIAPVITVGAAPMTVFPPNHKYVDVTLSALRLSAQDAGGVNAAGIVITKVTSDEADNGLGDGDTANDMIVAPDGKSVQLRAERSGTGNGRVYVVHLGVRDYAGNLGTATYRVNVPKSAKEAAVMDAVASEVVGRNP